MPQWSWKNMQISGPCSHVPARIPGGEEGPKRGHGQLPPADLLPPRLRAGEGGLGALWGLFKHKRSVVVVARAPSTTRLPSRPRRSCLLRPHADGATFSQRGARRRVKPETWLCRPPPGKESKQIREHDAHRVRSPLGGRWEKARFHHGLPKPPSHFQLQRDGTQCSPGQTP